MLRNVSRLRILSKQKVFSLYNGPRCNQSTSRQNKSGKENLIYLGGGLFVTLGGLVGYAAWNTKNQKGIQDLIPGSRFILEPLLGEIPEPPKPVETFKKPLDQGLLKKKLDREKEKSKQETEKPQLKKDEPAIKKPEPEPTIEALPPLAPPPLLPEELPSPASAPASEKEKDAVALAEGPPLQEETPKDAESAKEQTVIPEISANDALSKILQENMSLAQQSISTALKVAESIAEKVHSFAEKAYTHIDSDEGEEQLHLIAVDITKIKNELIRAVEEKLNIAKDAISSLQGHCSSGLNSEETKNNQDLILAKDKITELAYTMNKISSIVADALKESNALNEFKDTVLESRKQFEAELRYISQSGAKDQDDVALQLAHAQRKVFALQRHLAKVQTLDKGRHKEPVVRHKEQESRYIEGKLQAELERQKHELAMEYRRRLQQIREDNENEIRLQLKRQAAAHSDHLADMLHLRGQELEHKWQYKMEAELQREKDEYNKALSKINGQIIGLKTAMTERADTDKAAHHAQGLWTACQSLKDALRLGKENGKSWEEQLLPLQERIDGVMAAAGESNQFTEAVLSSISDISRKRGVLTEDALRERFIKVERICKRVSLVGDNGGSLIRYFLSYIQSFLIINAFEQLPANEVNDQDIDLTTLSTYDLLARAKYCLDKDDLLQALRYMNLLRGEPKHVAKDWISEARLTLEAKLAADALMAHAAATGTHAL